MRPPARARRRIAKACHASTLEGLGLGGGAADVLGRAQGGLPGGRPHLARLLLHGRHHPAREAPPRSPAACANVRAVTGCGIANVFHAGDGNLHPLILYDAQQAGELERAEAFGADILRLCGEIGGVLAGSTGSAWKNATSCRQCSRGRSPAAADACNARSTARACFRSPAGCFRRCTAAPSSAACHVRGGQAPFPTSRGSDHADAAAPAHRPNRRRDRQSSCDRTTFSDSWFPRCGIGRPIGSGVASAVTPRRRPSASPTARCFWPRRGLRTTRRPRGRSSHRASRSCPRLLAAS